MGVLGILQLINAIVPLGGTVLAQFRRNPATGQTDIQVTLSQASAEFDADNQQAIAEIAKVTAAKTPAAG